MSGLQISEESVKELCDRVANLGLAYQDAIGLLGEIIATLSIPQNQQLINEKLPELVPIMVRWIDRLPSVTCPDCRGNGCEPLPHDGVIAGCGTCKGIGKVYPTTPAPSKFKVGDIKYVRFERYKGIGVIRSINPDSPVGMYTVEMPPGSKYVGQCREDQLTESPVAPHTIELFDGCCLRDDTRAYWLLIFGEKFYIRGDHDRIRQISKNDIYAGIYTRDPDRDQHPVGSEWVDNDHPGDKWILWKDTHGRFALGDASETVFCNSFTFNNDWHATIADATRGARRCDTIEIKLDK